MGIGDWSIIDPEGNDPAVDVPALLQLNWGALDEMLKQEHSQNQNLTLDCLHRPGLTTLVKRDTAANVQALAKADGGVGYATDETPKSLWFCDGVNWTRAGAQVEIPSMVLGTGQIVLSTSFTAVAGLSITDTFRAGLLFAEAVVSCGFTTDADAGCELELRLDSTQKYLAKLHGMYDIGGFGAYPIHLMFMETVAVGSHTIDVRVRQTDTPDTFSIYADTSFQNRLRCTLFRTG